MSKHNKHNQNRPQNVEPAKADAVQAPAPESVEDLLDAATSPAEAPAEEVIANTATPQPEEAPAAPEKPAEPEVIKELDAPQPAQPKVEPPKPVAPAQPAAVVNPPIKKGNAGVTAEDVYPSVSPTFKKLVNIPSREHTPAGRRLKQMFDEYKAMMAVPTNDKMELKKRVMKLYQVMSIGCPASLSDAIVAQDLVRVAFDCLVEGWGTVYKDSNMFCLDYTLPGGPAAIDKLNMYWQAMIQLVEGAVEQERIMFDVDRLGIVIKNPIVTSAIAKMKANILERNKNLAENK